MGDEIAILYGYGPLVTSDILALITRFAGYSGSYTATDCLVHFSRSAGEGDRLKGNNKHIAFNFVRWRIDFSFYILPFNFFRAEYDFIHKLLN